VEALADSDYIQKLVFTNSKS